MQSEKRLILFVMVMMASIFTIDYVLKETGLVVPPKPRPKAAASLVPIAKAQPEALAKEKAQEKGKARAGLADVNANAPNEPKKPAAVEVPPVVLLDPSELILGSSKKQAGEGYRLELLLDQKGGGVAAIYSSQFEAEHEPGKPKGLPFPLLKRDPLAPLSFAMTLRDPKAAELLQQADAPVFAPGETPLDTIVWEVLKQDGKAVRAIKASRPGVAGSPPKMTDGQELTFTARVDDLGINVSKTFRLFQGEDGFDFDISFESQGKGTSKLFTYRLLGPHGIPIEGEWYTGTFRDFVYEGTDNKPISPISAYDIVSKKESQERFVNQPLKFVGIENQYFAAVVGPNPLPSRPELRWDEETRPVPLHEDKANLIKSDIGAEVLSRPLTVGPDAPVKHSYRVFAGPKTTDALAPFGAEQLAAYRKTSWIPFAPYIARAVITPLLTLMYDLTKWVANLFGWKNGNYGIAIILLTMSVRLAMFPLSRKQALSAKKMQDLQPQMKELQATYAEDKERLTRETWALYNKHGVNPIMGCLPALIQLPIFVGLWQALNNSVRLRNAPFLYIENLAAPDMLFRIPFEIPFLTSYLGEYFNLLPFLVVGMMLVQTKLFSPPATTPEQEMQQNMMKYMMVFMAFMFYKVPSGLGLYFLTSGLWQISERLLLPKLAAKHTPPLAVEGGGGSSSVKIISGTPTIEGPEAPAKPPGRFAKFWEKMLEEAQKNPTYRNMIEEKERNANGGREPNRNGNNGSPGSGSSAGGRDRNNRPDRGKPRPRPGRGGR